MCTPVVNFHVEEDYVWCKNKVGHFSILTQASEGLPFAFQSQDFFLGPEIIVVAPFRLGLTAGALLSLKLLQKG